MFGHTVTRIYYETVYMFRACTTQGVYGPFWTVILFLFHGGLQRGQIEALTGGVAAPRGSDARADARAIRRSQALGETLCA